ncbi:MAG: hypothetical protein RI964_2704 [Pseudomonadota bacterium]|jgi:hypothetical protein
MMRHLMRKSRFRFNGIHKKGEAAASPNAHQQDLRLAFTRRTLST